MAGYWIYRDGADLGRTTDVNFSDESAIAGSTYAYSVVAIDQQFNASSSANLTVTVPSAAVVAPPPNFKIVGITKAPPALPTPTTAPNALDRPMVTSRSRGGDSGTGMDPRRVGVRPAGGYWGGGGWSVKLAVSYNSQMWRLGTTNGTTWPGQDVGCGVGWKIQAGSLTPIYNNSGSIVYYLFTDSTGAEYSLNLPSIAANSDLRLDLPRGGVLHLRRHAEPPLFQRR